MRHWESRNKVMESCPQQFSGRTDVSRRIQYNRKITKTKVDSPGAIKSQKRRGPKNSWESEGFTREATTMMILEGRIEIYQAEEGIGSARSRRRLGKVTKLLNAGLGFQSRSYKAGEKAITRCQSPQKLWGKN